MQLKSIYLGRRRLSLWYSAIVTLILSVGGFGAYSLVVHLSWRNLEQEMASISTPLQTKIESFLQKTGQLDPEIQSLLSGICIPALPCESLVDPLLFVRSDPELIGRVTKGRYCFRVLNAKQEAIALIRVAGTRLSPCNQERFWTSHIDGAQGEFFKLSRPLYTETGQLWGTLQISRSIDELDLFLFAIELTLLIGIPLTAALICLTSWWLAKFAMQPVQQSYQQMQQFTADAAHEFRTPLAALRAMVQAALRAENLSIAEARETMEIIDRQSQRLSHLVQELLLLSRLDHQIQPNHLEPCCLNPIVKALIDELSALAETAAVKLIYRESEPDLEVLGDTEQLHRAILNLITNAIQYTPAKGIVTVRLFQNQSYACVQIQDTGIGIAIADQPKIFNRFYRINQANQLHKGTGLGLSIVAAIAQVHQGEVQVKSTEGQGSTFTLRIPVLRDGH